MTCASVACLIGAAHAPAFADDTQSVIERCKAAESDAARIACLEAALSGASTPTEPTAPAAPDSVAETSITPQAAPAPVAAAPTVADSFGAEQVVDNSPKAKEEKKKKSKERVVAAVTHFEINALGKATLTLENGQVWKQISSDSVSLRLREGRSYTAELRRGAVSGYRLKIVELKKNIKVRRVQ